MRTARLLALASLFAATAFVKSGPPWISIEYPANPFDSGSRGAFVLVHAAAVWQPTRSVWPDRASVHVLLTRLCRMGPDREAEGPA